MTMVVQLTSIDSPPPARNAKRSSTQILPCGVFRIFPCDDCPVEGCVDVTADELVVRATSDTGDQSIRQGTEAVVSYIQCFGGRTHMTTSA